MASSKNPRRKRRLPSIEEPTFLALVNSGGLLLTLMVLSVGLIFLLDQDKDAMPLGALAGMVLGYFVKSEQKARERCGVCGSASVPHTPEQCIAILKAKAEIGSKV